MHTTTLRGVFPDPKPVYRRNFIKENVKSIKQMQGLLQEAGVMRPRPVKDDKYRTVPPLMKSRDSTPPPHRTMSQENKSRLSRFSKQPIIERNKMESSKEKKECSDQVNEKFTNRSMQTERTDDLTKLYETGVIKYPSPGLPRPKNIQKGSPGKIKSHGDSLDTELQNLDIDDKDYIRENMTNFKTKPIKQTTPKVPAQAPPTYQRGVVPKYLRDRKEDGPKDDDDPCPEGHVLLPEEERKETLRVLRQSYADRIQELNSLPVRSDTLRIKKRKMEIEEELKRIDGGIKVFQRPKVYVKINA